LVKLVSQGKFQFSDPQDKNVTVEVREYKIVDPEWWSFLVEKNINRNLEITREENAK
jgi:hypothetical protein